MKKCVIKASQVDLLVMQKIAEEIANIEYNSWAEGCGLEDRNIIDRYEAMEYGWQLAMGKVNENGDFLYHKLNKDSFYWFIGWMIDHHLLSFSYDRGLRHPKIFMSN